MTNLGLLLSWSPAIIRRKALSEAIERDTNNQDLYSEHLQCTRVRVRGFLANYVIESCKPSVYTLSKDASVRIVYKGERRRVKPEISSLAIPLYARCIYAFALLCSL